MKKIFVAIFLCAVLAANVASAQMLRVSDSDVQTLLKSIAETIYTEEFQKSKPLILTNATEIANTELPEIGARAWGCQYGLKTSAEPDGEMVFFVDGEEKVSALKVVAYSEAALENAVIVIFETLQSLGLTSADAEFLINNLKDDTVLASSIVWSAEKNRCYVLMASVREESIGGFQFTLVATDKQN